jgi:hypothetical protein
MVESMARKDLSTLFYAKKEIPKWADSIDPQDLKPSQIKCDIQLLEKKVSETKLGKRERDSSTESFFDSPVKRAKMNPLNLSEFVLQASKYK